MSRRSKRQVPALGEQAVVLMLGDGSTTVGRDVRQAVFRAVYAEVNARLQAAAMRLGPVTYLNAEEAANSSATNDGQINRAWDLWRMAAQRAGRIRPRASATP